MKNITKEIRTKVRGVTASFCSCHKGLGSTQAVLLFELDLEGYWTLKQGHVMVDKKAWNLYKENRKTQNIL